MSYYILLLDTTFLTTMYDLKPLARTHQSHRFHQPPAFRGPVTGKISINVEGKKTELAVVPIRPIAKCCNVHRAALTNKTTILPDTLTRIHEGTTNYEIFLLLREKLAWIIHVPHLVNNPGRNNAGLCAPAAIPQIKKISINQ